MNRRDAVVTCLFFVACGGSSYAEADGSESGPCYPNQTCDPGLVCASGRCVHIDKEPPLDAGGGDVAEASSFADVLADVVDSGFTQGSSIPCNQPSSPPGRLCEIKAGVFSTCTSTQTCCTGTASCVSAGTCNGGITLDCTSPADCSSGICCAAVTRSAPSACDALYAFGGAHCKDACGTGEVSLCWGGGGQACSFNEQCVGAHLFVDFENDGTFTSLPIGYCRPQ